MANFPVKLLRTSADTLDITQLRQVRAPIGMWRFLTPLDTPQKGDLYRWVNRTGLYIAGWTSIHDAFGELMIRENGKGCEIIRPCDESATTIPAFDLSEWDNSA